MSRPAITLERWRALGIAATFGCRFSVRLVDDRAFHARHGIDPAARRGRRMQLDPRGAVGRCYFGRTTIRAALVDGERAGFFSSDIVGARSIRRWCAYPSERYPVLIAKRFLMSAKPDRDALSGYVDGCERLAVACMELGYSERAEEWLERHRVAEQIIRDVWPTI